MLKMRPIIFGPGDKYSIQEIKHRIMNRLGQRLAKRKFELTNEKAEFIADLWLKKRAKKYMSLCDLLLLTPKA